MGFRTPSTPAPPNDQHTPDRPLNSDRKDTPTMRSVMRGLALAALAALLLVAVGCGGGGDNKSSSGASGRGTEAPKSGEEGGTLTVLEATDVDYLDPGHTYYTFGYFVAYPTQRP